MRTRTAFASSLTLALALTACGGGENGEEAEDLDLEEIEVREEIRLAHSDQPQTMDPIATTAAVARNMGHLVFEPLFVLDADLEVQPMLAEDYEFNEDSTELTITIREDVPFHNGEILDAEDVVASLEHWTRLSNPGSTFFSDASYEATDDHTVVIEFEQPMALAPMMMADNSQMPTFIMPAEVVQDAPDTGAEEYIGTGPYSFGEWQRDQYIQFEAFEDYASRDEEPSGHAGARQANFENIYFDFVTDSSTRINGLQSQEYDLIHGLSFDNVVQVEGFPDADYEVAPAGILTAMFNKSDESLFNNQALREAAVAAIEPEQILLTAYADEEFYGATSSLMDEDSPWHIEPDEEFREFHQEVDQDLVDEKLEEAGYDGEELTILASSDQDDHYDTGIMLQQQLEEAGFNVTLQTLDWPTMLDAYTDPEAFDIAVDAYANYPMLPPTMLFLTPEGEGWADYDPLFDAGDAMIYAEDDDAAMEAMEDFQQAFIDYLPVNKIGDRTTLYGVADYVQGFEHVSGQGPIYHSLYIAE